MFAVFAFALAFVVCRFPSILGTLGMCIDARSCVLPCADAGVAPGKANLWFAILVFACTFTAVGAEVRKVVF